MRCAFRPRLVNGPFEDPVLFIAFDHAHRALIFDLGDIDNLSAKDLLKVSHVFVSHTHMDHFCGFDRLLRLCLGRSKRLWLCGPDGFLDNLAGKLSGYLWDLADNYADSLYIKAVEVSSDRCCNQIFECRRRFVPQGEPRQDPFETILIEEPEFSVATAILQHSSPCLAFRLTERFHVNILKPRLEELGLSVGPWLNRFKAALYAKTHADRPVTVTTVDGGRRRFALGQLAERIVRISAGQTIAYVTDAADTPENMTAILGLIRGADQLFIEAAFLERDATIARRRHHLTAARAGTIAAQAGVKEMHLMHFSPRYTDCGQRLIDEARQAYVAIRPPTA